MIILYHAGGSGGFELLHPFGDKDKTDKLIFNAEKLLKRRGHHAAAVILESVTFDIWEASNDFSDDFCVLYTKTPLDKYEFLRKIQGGNQGDFGRIAETLTELGPFTRFIACELEMEKSPELKEVNGVNLSDIYKLVNEYIGVSGGYLGDFTYRTHSEFYPQFCELELDPDVYQGTTRERFFQILKTVGKDSQAKIVRGILKKYPPNSDPRRSQALFDYFSALASRLEGSGLIPSPSIAITGATLKKHSTILKLSFRKMVR
jgi:hypothetical protein